MWGVRTHHEWQRQAAEGELFDVGLGDGAAGVDLVAGIILTAKKKWLIYNNLSELQTYWITLSKAGYTALSSVNHP